ncbi:MAG: basic amino acid ABC transporter substrate-binding protein [Deltaproteobacteria bacterium]|nr:basic amino acid ABC transporter substrate-binding protein [Deltaproteobacteria bacterium]
MFKKLVLGLAAAILLSQSAQAAGKTLTIAMDATWPPMEFINEKKEIVGFDADYLKAVAKEAGFTLVMKNVAWDGIFAGLESGKYDAVCSSVTITDERKKAMDFTKPYFKVRQALVVPKTTKAKSLAEMKGKNLGGQIGTTGMFAIKKAEGVTAKSYDEIGLAMEDLFNGRIDGVVCDDPVAAQYALQKKEYAAKLKIAAVLETGDEWYGIAVKKGNKEVLDLLDKGIEAVQKKGADKALRKKWIEQ